MTLKTFFSVLLFGFLVGKTLSEESGFFEIGDAEIPAEDGGSISLDTMEPTSEESECPAMITKPTTPCRVILFNALEHTLNFIRDFPPFCWGETCSETPKNTPTAEEEPQPPANTTVTIYEDASYGGKSVDVTLEGAECLDLPREYDNMLSSIKTHGSCVILCENFGCGGRCERIDDSSAAGAWVGSGFNDVVSSLKNCP